MNERHPTEDKLSEYALGITSNTERHTIETHVAECAACADQVRSIEDALELATPPPVRSASDEQVEASWHVILDHTMALAREGDRIAQAREAQDSESSPSRPTRSSRSDRRPFRWADWFRPSTRGWPQWSWQMAQIIFLAGLGFAAAWYLAGQGWLPGTQPPPESSAEGRSPSMESTRGWLAANGYAEQLEVLLMDLARGQEPSESALTPTVKEVSRNLLADARWYRSAADRAGDPLLADLLSEIEIVLLAVATVPEGQEDDLVAILRELIDEQNLLWRLRSVKPGDSSTAERDPATFGSSG